ncbi:hypothetical protein Pcinc_041849 [Petrolisthes cinctipes]|uniref:Uncharacterized protein n=1 Tax=Petrolisthes cinctipes TaxID=88211 RepID=A0AAE1BJB2_PETCI|nr:hypothetical protein Pcinc_041849 [Petrolisthes cinctipes]
MTLWGPGHSFCCVETYASHPILILSTPTYYGTTILSTFLTHPPHPTYTTYALPEQHPQPSTTSTLLTHPPHPTYTYTTHPLLEHAQPTIPSTLLAHPPHPTYTTHPLPEQHPQPSTTSTLLTHPHHPTYLPHPSTPMQNIHPSDPPTPPYLHHPSTPRTTPTTNHPPSPHAHTLSINKSHTCLKPTPPICLTLHHCHNKPYPTLSFSPTLPTQPIYFSYQQPHLSLYYPIKLKNPPVIFTFLQYLTTLPTSKQTNPTILPIRCFPQPPTKPLNPHPPKPMHLSTNLNSNILH